MVVLNIQCTLCRLSCTPRKNWCSSPVSSTSASLKYAMNSAWLISTIWTSLRPQKSSWTKFLKLSFSETMRTAYDMMQNVIYNFRKRSLVVAWVNLSFVRRSGFKYSRPNNSQISSRSSMGRTSRLMTVILHRAIFRTLSGPSRF